VTNSTGTVVYSAAHDPYGGVQQTWVNTFNPTPKFSGKERDGESDLDYFGARYYDRTQYRFISVDPIINSNEFQVSSQRMNLYSYCVNNPLSFMDIDGRDIVPVALTGQGGATLHTYLDSAFVSTVKAFIDCCASWGIRIEFNNAFRTQAEQDRIRERNPDAAKYSLHSAGWAFDIDNWNNLTEFQQVIVNLVASLLGIQSGADFNDPNHFYVDPWPNDIGQRQAAIEAASILWTYAECGVAGLSSMELYIAYGVFTESAAWTVIINAEIDLTSRQ
jgi:RHS repeat-associated protein